MFGIFGIFLENIANNKSGTLMLAGMTPWYDRVVTSYVLSRRLPPPNASKHQPTSEYQICYWRYSPKLYRKCQTCHIFVIFCIF